MCTYIHGCIRNPTNICIKICIYIYTHAYSRHVQVSVFMITLAKLRMTQSFFAQLLCFHGCVEASPTYAATVGLLPWRIHVHLKKGTWVMSGINFEQNIIERLMIWLGIKTPLFWHSFFRMSENVVYPPNNHYNIESMIFKTTDFEVFLQFSDKTKYHIKLSS